MEKDEFLTISAPSEGFYSELRSKFLAFSYHVADEKSVKCEISELKRKFHDARHVAYAYIIGV